MPEKKHWLFFALFLVAVFTFSFSVDKARRNQGGFLSDEATYFSMIQSLALDQDIVYERRDIARIKERFWVGPMGLFLKKGADGRLTYSKSLAYPLFAAPFFLLFDNHGVLLCNGLMLFFCLLMGYLLLRKTHPPEKSFSFSLIFVLCSVTPIYIWWFTADLFNFFVLFSGLFFFFYPFRLAGLRFLAVPFFTLAVFSKPSTLVPLAFVLLILPLRKRWKETIVFGLLLLLALAALATFYYSQSGTINFMGGDRRTFYSHYPYEQPGYTFEKAHQMTASDYWERFHLTPAIAGHNIFYYFFGRFTGLLIYFFPALFLLLLFFLQKKSLEDWLILAAICAGILTLALLVPENYFGGAGSVGNRYFLTIYPLFFFLGYKERIFRLNLLPLAAAAVFLLPIIADGFNNSAFPGNAGELFPARHFPPEKTQYKSLPSNSNPRAFNNLVADKYWLFFLNSNFYSVEAEHFWTYGRHEAELFLVVPEPAPREIWIKLSNPPRDNRVRVIFEHQSRTVKLKAGENQVIKIGKPGGLAVDRGRIYRVRIRSDESYSPYFSEPGSEDQRLLGIRVHFALVH